MQLTKEEVGLVGLSWLLVLEDGCFSGELQQLLLSSGRKGSVVARGVTGDSSATNAEGL
jgi:hypothetical protein